MSMFAVSRRIRTLGDVPGHLTKKGISSDSPYRWQLRSKGVLVPHVAVVGDEEGDRVLFAQFLHASEDGSDQIVNGIERPNLYGTKGQDALGPAHGAAQPRLAASEEGCRPRDSDPV